MAKHEDRSQVNLGLTLSIGGYEMTRFDVVESGPPHATNATPVDRLEAFLSLYQEVHERVDVIARLTKRHRRLPTADEIRAEMAHLLNPSKGK